MNITLTAELIAGFEAIKDTIAGLPDENARKSLILETCQRLCSRYNDRIVTNTMNIINYYIDGANVEIEELIRSLRVNCDIDYYTARREEEDGFDIKFGTTTSLILRQYELPESISLYRFQTSGRCHPSPISSVKMALKELASYKVRYNDFVFIDIGSGLGRNLLLAADYNFKEIIGIEHSAYLHELALENVEKYCAGSGLSGKFQLHCMDALDYVFPESNIVFYFWRPFTEDIAAKFVKKLESFTKENQYNVMLLFLGQVYHAIKQSPFLELLDMFFTPAIIDREGTFFPVSVYSRKSLN